MLHDLNLTARYCDRLILLDNGTVAQSGSPEHVLDPTLLERVYGVSVRRVYEDDTIQLIFSPTDPPTNSPSNH